MNQRRYFLGVLVAFLAALLPHEASAHVRGENYIFMAIHEEALEGRFEFHIEDLQRHLGIQFDDRKPEALLQRIEASAEQVQDYIRTNFLIRGDETPLTLTFEGVSILAEVTTWAQFHFRIALTELPEILSFNHRLMFEAGRLHQGLLVVTENILTGQAFGPEGDVVLVFNQGNAEQSWNVAVPVEPLLQPRDFVWQGILHIWIGLDHILFLVVLLLPAVLRHEQGRWVAEDSFWKSMWIVVKIVTLFTIAHSITLALAALDLVNLPGRLVESIIAASILLVAANNINPKLRLGTALVIFLFGLFHGLGFASVMGDIPFRMNNLVKILIAFNVGVEIGQIAVVMSVFGFLFLLRRAASYQPLVLRAGSAAAGLVAGYWLVQRAFDL